MISIKKLAPGRLWRAILAGRSGNESSRSTTDAGTMTVYSNDVFNRCADVASLNRRITITVETERLLILNEKQNWPDEPTYYPADDK